MGAISSLSAAGSALRRNPVLFVAGFFAGVVGSASLAVQVVDDATVVVLLVGFGSLLLSPFVTGGLLGMAEEAVGGRTRLGTFLRAGAGNYLSILGAILVQLLLVVALTVVFVVVAVILAAVLGVALTGSGDGGASAALGLSVGLGLLLVYLLFLLGVLAFFFFLQFYDAAVVVDDAGPVGSLRRSAGFVRRNFLSALGYSVLAVLVGLLNLVPTAWLLSASGFPDGSAPGQAAEGLYAGVTLTEIVPILVVSVLLSTLVGSFLGTYKATFYLGGRRPWDSSD